MSKSKSLELVPIGSIADNAEAVSYFFAHLNRFEIAYEPYENNGIVWLRCGSREAAKLREWVSGFSHGLAFAANRS